MTLTFRAALAVFALILSPLAVSAQTASLDERIEAACGGVDQAACTALIAELPANSPLVEQALRTAIGSPMSAAQLGQVIRAARITPNQADRLQVVAGGAGRTSAALSNALNSASGQQVGGDDGEVAASAG